MVYLQQCKGISIGFAILSALFVVTACSPDTTVERNASPFSTYTQTTSSYDDATNVLTYLVKKNGKLHSTTWAIAIKCSGKIGQAGTFVEPKVKLTEKGIDIVGSTPGMTRSLTKRVWPINLGDDKPPNFQVWRTTLQRACDENFTFKAN